MGYRAGKLAQIVLARAAVKKCGELLNKKGGEIPPLENEGGSSAKIINSTEVKYNQSSIDKAFSKHSTDFGSYPDGSKVSVEAFKNDINN